MLRLRPAKSPASGIVAAGWMLAAVAMVHIPEGRSQGGYSESGYSEAAYYEDAAPAHHHELLLRAISLQERDEHGAALPLLREALLATRARDGLYHEDQLDILHRLIESESMGANWRQVDDYFALLRSLYERLYADDPGCLELGLALVTDWHVDALRHDLDGRPVPHLRQARELFKQRLRLAEAAANPDAGKIERLRRNIGIAESHLTLYSLGDSQALREWQARQREVLLSSNW